MIFDSLYDGGLNKKKAHSGHFEILELYINLKHIVTK